MAYTKLDEGITDSTIWQEPDTTRIVWITMLAMADQNGYIGASMPGLAGRARVSLEACITAVETFLAPDKWSRTRDHDGRRVAEAEGGWILLNHAKYREAKSADDRRERSRVAMAALRQKRKLESQVTTVNTGEPELTKLAQAEAEAEVKRKKASPSAPNGHVVTFGAGGEWTIPNPLREQWRAAYPAVSVEAELAKASAWLTANPKNRKSNYARFLNSWLSRAQDKAPPVTRAKSRDDVFAGAH